jgi:hypothetical protein
MSFRHKSSLSRHGKIHNKSTQCHLCHRSFRYESFLKKHLQSAHENEDNAFLQPTPSFKSIDKFSKDEIIEEYVDDDEEDEEDSSQQQQQEYVEITYDEQNGAQIVNSRQYHQLHPSTSSTANRHSYT